MTKDEALRLALEFIPSINPAFICEASHHKKHERHASNEPCPHVAKQKQVYEAIKAALEAKDEFDWKDMYEKQKRHSEMWVAKYEKDIGPLEKAVPQQEAKDEPVAWKLGSSGIGGMGVIVEPQRTWVGLTDEEVADIERNSITRRQAIRAIEAKLRSKNYD